MFCAGFMPEILGLFAFCWGIAGCRSTSLKRFSPRIPQWVFLLLMCRLGEALNPGPDDFVLGTFNPSGLKGKAQYIVSQLAYGDLWAVTETHLCDQSLRMFRSSLHFAQGPYRYCVAGHPVPAQQNRVFHSAWRGVAVLSKHPTRLVPTHWPEGLYESSRSMVTTTLINNVWMTGATVYGEPESGSYPNQKANNEALLHAAVSQVCFLNNGPRFVAGDWNVEWGSLPVFDMLSNAGFVDLQDLAASMWGSPIAPTCKEKTRKDFCFISRELQSLLKGVQVVQDVFPDHAVLQGVFHTLGHVSPRNIWPVPLQFPWPTDWNVDPRFWDQTTGTCDHRYAALWQHIEHQATLSLPFPVPKLVRGRASTTEVKKVRDGRVPPPKRARNGEVKPQYLAASFRHSQWLRQVRRLQSYIRHVHSQSPSTEHARNVWGSIVRARGFHPTFHDWWPQCSFRTFGAPQRLPYVPPTCSVAERIFDTVMIAFRNFESELFKASRLYARHHREQNPNMIFQDIRQFNSKGVNVLASNRTAQILEIRAEESAVVLDRPLQLAAECPVFCNGTEVSVIHHEQDCVWVEDLQNFEVGMQVSQPRYVGANQELFDVFVQAWREMWGRHQQVPENKWHDILQFAHTHMLRQSHDWPSLDSVSLSQCITHKKATTSAGLDGVTVQDLRAMPLNALSNFVSMFHHAEATGEWPTLVVAGRVTCLAKNEDPQTPFDFRPITVLGLLFRCWGTYHSKNALRLLDSTLPEGLYGSRPRCFAGQVWSQLLWTIELAYATDLPLSGIVADIRKAFNYLPRVVVFEACALLGIPFRVLRAWAGALTTMPRRFLINGDLSQPTLSTCGLPEGCAMSCVGMMAVDVLYHLWMKAFFPMCQPISYVDDWQILVPHPDAIRPVFTCLDKLVEALDLFLDPKKTCTWSVSKFGRSVLRDQGFTLVSYGRNLGAHVQFTKQHTNSVLMERITGVSSLWPKLRVSPCPYKLKVRAVLSAAWPKALHGVAATTLSQATFQSLRAGAMKGLRADAAGVNAHVHLGLVERPHLDPQCWAIQQTFRLTRDCGQRHRVELVLAELADGSLHLPHNTVTQTLLHRVQSLGWHVNMRGQIEDMFGAFSLFKISMTELQYRIDFQWKFLVAQEVSHRPCFEGLFEADPHATREWLRQLSLPDRALFRCVLNGCHITQDGKKHCQQTESDVCPFCLCSDSRYHRFWECEAFAHLRNHVSDHDRRVIRDLPQALTCSGWAMHPTTIYDWHVYFASLRLPVPAKIHPPVAVVHLFTDGSCHKQGDVNLRFAAFSIVLADARGVHGGGAQVLDQGPLPGLLQSAIRAEIFAVRRAMQMVETFPGPVHLWTDCEAVVRRFRRLQAGHELKTNGSHFDLWSGVQLSLCLRPALTSITRVSAHVAVDSAETVLQEWCFYNNGVADQHAVEANFQRPDAFWDLHARHCKATAFVQYYSQLVQNVQLDISRDVVAADQSRTLEVDPEACVLPFPEPHWTKLPPPAIPLQAVRWYGDAVVRQLVSWFWFSIQDSTFPLVWVSHFQLYIDFMLCTGSPGPVHLGSWKNGSDIVNLHLRGLGFKQRTRWFIKVLKETIRHQQLRLTMGYGRPASHMILFHTGILALPWPPWRLKAIDMWLQTFSTGSFRRQSKALDSLPFAPRCDSFPLVPLTTI